MLAASAGETNEEQFKASHAEPELNTPTLPYSRSGLDDNAHCPIRQYVCQAKKKKNVSCNCFYSAKW